MMLARLRVTAENTIGIGIEAALVVAGARLVV